MMNVFGMMDYGSMMNSVGIPIMGSILGLGILGLIIAVALAVFWLWMLIDLLQKKNPDKLAWVLVLIFLNILGAILYYFMVFSKGKKK